MEKIKPFRKTRGENSLLKSLARYWLLFCSFVSFCSFFFFFFFVLLLPQRCVLTTRKRSGGGGQVGKDEKNALQATTERPPATRNSQTYTPCICLDTKTRQGKTTSTPLPICWLSCSCPLSEDNQHVPLLFPLFSLLCRLGLGLGLGVSASL